jgi:hypothetical protein
MPVGPEQLRLSPDERANLVAYIDGELPETNSRAIATKLTQSATARREVEMLKKTWELLDYLPMPQVEQQFAERTITQIRLLETGGAQWEPTFQTWAGYLGLAAIYAGIGAACLAVGYAGTRWIWPDDGSRLANELSLVEHLDAYLDVGSFDFLKQLADSSEFNGDTN